MYLKVGDPIFSHDVSNFTWSSRPTIKTVYFQSLSQAIPLVEAKVYIAFRRGGALEYESDVPVSTKVQL